MKKLLALLLLTTFSLSCFAWGTTGHRVVAEIAERNLSKKAKKELNKLIGKESLAFWANWSDFIKSDTTGKWKAASKWHYVDLPGHITKEDFITQLKDLKGDNLYTMIPKLEAKIKDENLSKQERNEALYFLIHMIGDLHQPLHVGRDEDQGGNKIQLTWFSEKTNLHSVWDEKLIEYQQWSYTEYANVLNIADETKVSTIQSGTLEDWFYESHVLSDKVYDLTPADSKLKYNYNYIFANDLNNQLLKGGLRLAKILNELFA